MSESVAEPDKRTAVDKAMALLCAFDAQEVNGVGVTELARRAGMSKSTAFRLLKSLEHHHAVERVGTAYCLGPMISHLGGAQETEYQALIRDTLTPYLVDLYERTRHTVHLAVLQGVNVKYLNKLYGRLRVRSPSRIGGKAPAYSTAVGKALLAFSPEHTSLMLETKRRAWTAKTLTSEQELLRELSDIRDSNLSYDRQEIVDGLTCVGSAVLNPASNSVAAFSVSGAAGTFVPENVIPDLRKVCYEASRAVSTVTKRSA